MQLRCTVCGTHYYSAATAIVGTPCTRANCAGTVVAVEKAKKMAIAQSA